ncbi:MAG: hypothetical protein WCP98_16115 [Actinomycetes bacterium]
MEAAVEAARRRALARGLAAEFLVLSIAAETAADLAGEGRRAWPARIEPVANP